MTESLHIAVAVIYSDQEEIAGSKAILRTRGEAASIASTKVEQIILSTIPWNRICSVVTAHKIEGEHDGKYKPDA